MSKLSFCEFLLKQVCRDDPVGDFASDMLRDSNYPKESSKLTDWYIHLGCRNACSEAKHALVEAFMEYEEIC